MEKQIEQHKNSFWTKAAYGSGDMYAGGGFLIVGLLYLNFLTDIVGLSGKLAGLIFLLGEIWDAFTDPLMGYISDRTKSRFGRRRVYFLIGIFPIFFSFALIWFNFQSGNTWLTFAFHAFAYLLFNTVFTMVMVPYNALLPNMVKKYHERTEYNVFRFTFSALSAILSGVFPMLIINNFESSTTGYLAMGIIFGLLYAIPWIFVFKKTWELPVEEELVKGPAMKVVFAEFKQAFKNRAFRRHSSFFVATQTATDFLMALFLYYLTWYLGRKPEFSAIMGVLLVTQLIMMSIHGKVAKRFGKTTPLKVGICFWIVGVALAYFITKDSPNYMIYLVAALAGMGTSASTFVPWSILPEVSDVDELITGKRREGVYAGMSTLIRKIANAVTVQFIGIYLDVIGYVGTAETQTVTATNGIKQLFVIGPFVFTILGFILVSRYNMTKERHEILMEEIESRKAGKGKTSDPAIIDILEDLSGVSLEEQSSFE